ncbi:HK97 family phage prohead protease [Zavarzinella formosa]|uniref:HK97 family phage prohead protease n=1 Tax=Zavarzinella formosa TaxID=360055 RepID=UPI0003151874|nr:HK97 family phage prohead protease [Zavarzinella formosa]
MKLQHKTFLLRDIEVKEDGETRTIEGYGSTFGNEDSYGDVVMPGAFTKSLLARKPAMLWQHNSDQPIGVWDQVMETPQGLLLKGRVFATQCGNDAYTLAKGGAITGLSIGFSTKKSEMDTQQNIRRLQEVDLYEVSLVTFPANTKATVTGVKSASDDIDAAVALLEQAANVCQTSVDVGVPIAPDMAAGVLQMLQAAVGLLDAPEEDTQDKSALPMTERQLEKHLRDASFSQREAKAIIAEGYKALTKHRDGESESLNQLTHLFNQFKA